MEKVIDILKLEIKLRQNEIDCIDQTYYVMPHDVDRYDLCCEIRALEKAIQILGG